MIAKKNVVGVKQIGRMGHGKRRFGKNKKRTVCFLGTGGIFSYALGVAHYLKMTFDINQDVHATGLSGGSMAAALLCLKKDVREWHDEYLMRGVARCQQDWWINNYLDHLGMWSEFGIRTDGFDFQNANGRLKIQVAKAWDFGFEEHVVEEWTSNKDLVGGVLAACHIPFCLDGCFGRPWRNEHWYDYGVTRKPVSLQQSFDMGPVLTIGPRSQWRAFPVSWQTLWKDPHWMMDLFNLGYSDCIANAAVFDRFFDPDNEDSITIAGDSLATKDSFFPEPACGYKKEGLEI